MKIMKLTGKRKQIYNQLLKEGRSEKYAKRISKGLSEGKRLSEARGHKEERYRKLPEAYQPGEKGRIEKKKEEWLAYAYVDPIQGQKYRNTYLSVTSRDLTKTKVKNYEKNGSQEALYRVHQFLEDETNSYLIHERLDVVLSDFDELHVDSYHEKISKRRFELEIVDLQTEVVRFFIIYEKGKIKKSQIWEGFPIVEFQVVIGSEEIWN